MCFLAGMLGKARSCAVLEYCWSIYFSASSSDFHSIYIYIFLFLIIFLLLFWSPSREKKQVLHPEAMQCLANITTALGDAVCTYVPELIEPLFDHGLSRQVTLIYAVFIARPMRR